MSVNNKTQTKESASESEDEQVIESAEITGLREGGEITGLNEDKFDYIDRHKADTARWLAYALVIALAGSFVIHYITMALLAAQNKTAALEVVERAFSAWLPIISGLTGAAVTYFFTKERNGKS